MSVKTRAHVFSCDCFNEKFCHFCALEEVFKIGSGGAKGKMEPSLEPGYVHNLIKTKNSQTQPAFILNVDGEHQRYC